MVSEPSACTTASAGTLMAYARRREDGCSELVVYDRTRGAGRVVWSAAEEGDAASRATIDDIAVSADGRTVAFVCSVGEVSSTDGLTLNAYADVHLYDTVSGRRTRLGAAGELDSILGAVPLIREVAVSADGERIAFVAEKLRGFPGQADVFVHDRGTGTLAQVNPSNLSPCRDVVISGDGRSVFFTDAAARLHVHDADQGRTRALPIVIPKASAAGHYSVSDDGRFISFTSLAYGVGGEVRLFDRRTGAVESKADLPLHRRATPPAGSRVRQASGAQGGRGDPPSTEARRSGARSLAVSHPAHAFV